VPDPAALALIPVAGVIAAALIAGLFSLAGRRSDAQLAAAEAAERVRAQLLADYEARIRVLTEDRDEARADRDESRRQVEALERRIVECEGRPTRGVKP
jgi:hypothetical protein